MVTHNNVVFVGRDRNGTPRYTHVRGTADPFRQDIAGAAISETDNRNTASVAKTARFL